MPKVTIKSLQERIAYLEENLNKGKEHESWQTREIQKLRDEIVGWKTNYDELKRDKQWLRQLCQELSSSVNGYMRSR